MQGPLAVPDGRVGLRRELTVLGLVAMAVCTVIGGGINVLSVEVQGKVPGMAWMVPLAFVLGVTPALFAALCYAVLASAMPRAGGGYMYVSRGLHPFLGFMATFSKWFGLASVVGVIAYLDVPLIRDAAHAWGAEGLAEFLDTAWGTLWIPLLMIWVFWLINLLGMRSLGYTVIVLMVLLLSGGLCLIVTGLWHTHADFAAAMAQKTPPVDVDYIVGHSRLQVGGLRELMAGTGFLFFAYIGFATISQAGSEARDPQRALPRAFVIATVVITAYYLLFSAAFYHAVPWQYVARETMTGEAKLTAPGVIGVLMPPLLAGLVALSAGIALAADIPPMLMAVSRLFFSWAEDGVFPKGLARVNKAFHTPHWALTACALVATVVVVECHLRPHTGFFAGVDMVTMALLFTYMIVSVAVITLPRRNPELYAQVAFIRSRPAQIVVALIAIATIGTLLGIQVNEDIKATRTRIAVQMMQFPVEGRCHRAHTWVQYAPEAPIREVTIGLTAFGAYLRTGLTSIELPPVGEELVLRETFGVTYSDGVRKPLVAPVTGEVVAVNEAAVSQPALVQTDPYGQGWLLRVKPEGPEALSALMSVEDYMSTIEASRPEGLPLGSAVVHSLVRSSAFVWVVVLLVGAIIFAWMWARKRAAGEDPNAVFMTLPVEAEDDLPLI